MSRCGPHPAALHGASATNALAVVRSGAGWDAWKVASCGAGDWVAEPPSENTCSWVAVPPFDDVGVPPDVIATYSVPPTE